LSSLGTVLTELNLNSLGTVPSEFKYPAVIVVIVIAVIDGIAKCTVYDSEIGYLNALSSAMIRSVSASVRA
jgi:hypothetical protein